LGKIEQCRTPKGSSGKRTQQSNPAKTLEERKSRPVSRVLSRTVIHLGCKSPSSSSNLPRDRAGHASVPLFDLAPGGVYHATPVTSCAVRSYRTFSPLPVKDRRYIFCGTFRRLTPPRRYLAPCPMEPGLSSILSCDKTATAQPTLSARSVSHIHTDVICNDFISKQKPDQKYALVSINEKTKPLQLSPYLMQLDTTASF